MSTISSFTSIENDHDVDRYKNCMKRFCKSLGKHAMEIINSKKKKIKSLTNNSRNHMKIPKNVLHL